MPHISPFHEPHRLAAKYAAKTPETANKLATAIRNIRAKDITETKTINNSLFFTIDKTPSRDIIEIETRVGNKTKNVVSIPANQENTIGEKIYDMFLALGEKFKGEKTIPAKPSKNAQLFKDAETARFYDITDAMLS